MPTKVIMMHLKTLFDLDNLISDKEEYKKLGFNIDEEGLLSLKSDRTETLKKIPKDLVETYERLRIRYPLAIFADVKNGFCFGCFQKLPTEITTKSSEIIMCPNCGRILYWRQ